MDVYHHKITPRQLEVLLRLREKGESLTGKDGGVLRGLLTCGYVNRHEHKTPMGSYYTWTLTEEGLRFTNQEVLAHAGK